MFENFFITIIVILSFILVSALAGAVGIGGGGFFIPILMIMGGLTINDSIPIASSTILGVGLASTIINIKEKTVNFKIGVILEPSTILGSIIGFQLYLISSESVLMTIFITLMILLTIRSYQKANRLRKNNLLEEPEEIIYLTKFNRNKMLLGITGSISAGILSALVGIGGGLIKVPMLNELGLSPTVSSGTGSFMVFFTSFSNTIQYMFFTDRLEFNVAIIFFLIGFSSSFIGTFLSRYNSKPETIQYLLTFAIGCSTILIILTWIFT